MWWCRMVRPVNLSEVVPLLSTHRVRQHAGAASAVAFAIAALLCPSTADARQDDIVLHPSAASDRAGRWTSVADSSAVDGKKMRNQDRDDGKITAAKAKPADYFELTFNADRGTPYRLWLHGRAEGDDWSNDSVFVQFSGSVTPAG